MLTTGTILSIENFKANKVMKNVLGMVWLLMIIVSISLLIDAYVTLNRHAYVMSVILGFASVIPGAKFWSLCSRKCDNP